MSAGVSPALEVARAVDVLRHHRLAGVADVARAVDGDGEALASADLRVARAADDDVRAARVEVAQVRVARPVHVERQLLGRAGELDVARAGRADGERPGVEPVGLHVARPGQLEGLELRHGRLDDDVAAPEAVVAEPQLERAVVHLGADVVDDLLAGQHPHGARRADPHPRVDRAAVVDAGERGDVARLRRLRAVVADVAAGQYEDGKGGGGEEEAEHAPIVGPRPCARHGARGRGRRGLSQFPAYGCRQSCRRSQSPTTAM